MLPLVADEVWAALVAIRGSYRGPPAAVESVGLAEAPVSVLGGYLPGLGGLVVGAVLLLTPADLFGRAALHGHAIGATVGAIAVLALGQPARVARWGNVSLGLGLVAASVAFG